MLNISYQSSYLSGYFSSNFFKAYMGTKTCFDHGSVEVPEMKLEGTVFPSTVIPPCSSKALFLGGAGVRGVHVNGNFMVITLSGVYLESEAVNFLTEKWRGKSAEQLSSSNQFFHDIITGPFDKLSQITLVAYLSGKEFAQKVMAACKVFLKQNCLYSQKEENAAKQFEKYFEPIDLPPGSTIFYTYSASGHLMVTFSKDTSVPEVGGMVINCPNLTEALLATIIGENGVSPATKLSLASRMYGIMNSV